MFVFLEKEKYMHILETKILIKASLEEVWAFFSSPANLRKITPPQMGFHILSGAGRKMYPGQIISYRVKPIAGIPLTWVTEITHVKELNYFVDEQRFGPYSMWHHEHHFREVEAGVEMKDIVSYKLPLGILGRLVHFLFVKRMVQQIFDYRSQIITDFFEVQPIKT